MSDRRLTQRGDACPAFPTWTSLHMHTHIYTNVVFKSTYEYESYIFCIFVVQFRWWRSIREDGGSGGGGPYAKSGNLRIHQTQGASKRCYVARTPTVSNRPKVPRDSDARRKQESKAQAREAMRALQSTATWQCHCKCVPGCRRAHRR